MANFAMYTFITPRLHFFYHGFTFFWIKSIIYLFLLYILGNEGILKCRFSLAWNDSVSMRYELGMREATAQSYTYLELFSVR